jgi:ABC-type taurine transport system substrate-binding protein
MSKFVTLVALLATALAANPEDANLKAQKELADAAQEDLDAQADRIAELELENEEAVSKISKLSSQPAEKVVFEHKGAKYELTAGKVKLREHGVVTATDIAASEELQAALVNSQSGLIKKVN